MNKDSQYFISILHFFKCCLFIIPLCLSLHVEERWRENQAITKIKLWHNSNYENPEMNNKFNVAKQLFLLNMFATVIAWNIFYSFKIPIPNTTFLITFFILSILCGFYLLYIRINFKYEE